MASSIKTAAKRAGNFADSFASMSGGPKPLPQEYLLLKRELVTGQEEKLTKAWKKILKTLEVRNQEIADAGSSIIPSFNYITLQKDLSVARKSIRAHGCGVIRGVIPESKARGYKDGVERYLAANPNKTAAFPSDNPQVWELYWSAPQIEARAHPNILALQRTLMAVWDEPSDTAEVDLNLPVSYADRLRIRQPGDATFSLGPHVDGGSVERWEKQGYGKGKVYDELFRGEVDAWSVWNVERRLNAVMDNHEGLGACSTFRMFQAWLSISRVAPGEGTLLVYPDVQLSTAYLLLRPFFRPIRDSSTFSGNRKAYLDASNWIFAGDEMTSDLHGAPIGTGMELNNEMHPHLELSRTMTHMPEVSPGDYVIWHCDAIHAVDPIHQGTSDSSVMYIPVCPLSRLNVKYLIRQREAFRQGYPGPDFPGGKGESEHVGRLTEDAVKDIISSQGLQALGILRLEEDEGTTSGAKRIRVFANEALDLWTSNR